MTSSNFSGFRRLPRGVLWVTTFPAAAGGFEFLAAVSGSEAGGWGLVSETPSTGSVESCVELKSRRSWNGQGSELRGRLGKPLGRHL